MQEISPVVAGAVIIWCMIAIDILGEEMKLSQRTTNAMITLFLFGIMLGMMIGFIVAWYYV